MTPCIRLVPPTRTRDAAAVVHAPVLQLPDECHADAVRLLEKLLSVLGERKSGRDLATNFKAVYSQMQYTADGRSLAHELFMQLIALLSRTPVRVWLLLSLVCARGRGPRGCQHSASAQQTGSVTVTRRAPTSVAVVSAA